MPSTSVALPAPNRRLRRALIGVAVLGVLGSASACTTNFSAQTDQIYNSGIGVSDRASDVDVLDAYIIDTGNNTGSVSASLIDNVHATDQLVSITANTFSGDTTVPVTQPTSKTFVAYNSPVVLGTGKVVYALKGTASAPVTAGFLMKLTFTFKNADPVVMDVPVVKPSDIS